MAYEVWLGQKFSLADLSDPNLEPSLWGIDADPNEDAWTNRFEFYLNLDPNRADEPDFELNNVDNVLTFNFSRRANVFAGWAHPASSIDLQDWSTEGLSVGVVAGPGEGIESVTVTVSTDGVERLSIGLDARP